MSERWWRAKNGSVNNRKLQKLPGELFKAWYNINCLASDNDGVVPALEDVAFALRLSEQRAAAILTQLIVAKLLDKVGDKLIPHDWNEHQFKSDVTDPTAPTRMQRYRERKRNERNDTVTGKRPEADTEADTEAEQTHAAVSHETKNEPNDISIRVLKTDLMDAFGGSSKCPDLTRASTWVSMGYAPSMVVEVVRELIARKPDIANLAYFDKALAERHDKRASTPSERAAGVPPETMDWALSHFAKGGHWSRQAGPEPGQPGCKATAAQLAKHGLGLDGQKLRESA